MKKVDVYTILNTAIVKHKMFMNKCKIY